MGQIQGDQILDGTVTDADISATAAIQTSKLADAANLVKKDGSVAFTGAVNAGNNKVTNVANGTAASDAVNKGQLDAAVASLESLVATSVLLSKLMWNDVPTDPVNGTNKNFQVSYDPASEVLLFKNGVLQKLTTDYTRNGTVFTFVTAPQSPADIRFFYVRT